MWTDTCKAESEFMVYVLCANTTNSGACLGNVQVAFWESKKDMWKSGVVVVDSNSNVAHLP